MIALRSEPAPVFDHLIRLTDGRGLFEHARYDEPRSEHGYCVDDVARGLVVLCREPRGNPALVRLERHYLEFVCAAVQSNGDCHNRMRADGKWIDQPAVGDWWGRALWGLGTAAARASTPGLRARALTAFRIAAQRRSPHLHAMAFAALGAAELLSAVPDDLSAQRLLSDAADLVGRGRGAPSWPWPEPRLRYANGAVAESLIVAGAALNDPLVRTQGLAQLEFLLGQEIRAGHLSMTPVGGRGPGESEPGFDQQPIEVAALADACASAYRASGDVRWLEGIRLGWSWFLGDNDSATPMFDPLTGGGFDGLQRIGCNRNQGAESTLAMLSTAQQARWTGDLS
jgi:hypothetical protein